MMCSYDYDLVHLMAEIIQTGWPDGQTVSVNCNTSCTCSLRDNEILLLFVSLVVTYFLF